MDENKSWKSLPRLIDWILPPVIIAYSCWGLYVSIFHVGLGWLDCHRKLPSYAGVYIVFSLLSVSTIIGLVLFLWTLHPDHDVPPRVEYTTVQAWFDRFPRECLDKDGTLAKCNRDRCGGRVKPPRTHHCSVCQTCRMEWDHHCPWIGNCLTIRQSKAFLMLLVTTAFGVCVMVTPVIRPIFDGAQAMYAISRANPRCKRLWWDWWGSYVVFGGPGGRWVLGTALGYLVTEDETPSNPRHCRYGTPFMKPTLSATLTVVAALCLAGFCLVLALQMGFRLLRGQTTIEALQNGVLVRKKNDFPGRFLWLPSRLLTRSVDTSHAMDTSGASTVTEGIRYRTPILSEALLRGGIAVPLDSNARVYDLGIWRNAKTFWDRPLLGPETLPQILREPPEINPDIIERIKDSRTCVQGGERD